MSTVGSPPLSIADLNAVPAGEKRVTLQQAQAQPQNSVRSTLLQGLAGVLVIGGALATWRQVQISREGQITDRLTHAVDQLGNDKVDVRIGGIYALERLAKDSSTDRLAIVEILAAFIRTHAPWPAGSMGGANLRDADLRDANLTRADLRGADLSGAVLLDTRLADVRTDNGYDMARRTYGLSLSSSFSRPRRRGLGRKGGERGGQ